jgi:conjugative transfer signal peptidase TraF
MKAQALLGMAVALALVVAPFVCTIRPLYIWNASPSVPTGWYWVGRASHQVGDLVVVRLPPVTAAMAARRGYLPRWAYLLKPVAAVGGDHVCRLSGRVFVRRKFTARASATDNLGRPLPVWLGCRMLRSGEIFLLAHGPASFDSRYFGPLLIERVVGRAMRVWPRQLSR